jgi:Flp pilus assembly protein TadG
MTQPNTPKTRSWLKRLTAPMRRVLSSEEGTATIDFVLCIPVIMMIFIASIESGVLMTRYLLLERSVDIVMRNLRLGEYPNPTSAFLKTEICKRSTILDDCEANITIALEPINETTWVFPARAAGCVDRSKNISPALTYNPGAAHEIVMVRVCVVQDAVFPTTGFGLNLPKDAKGGYGLITTSAFVNEP